MNIPPMPVVHCVTCNDKKSHPVCFRKACVCTNCNIFTAWLDSGKVGQING